MYITRTQKLCFLFMPCLLLLLLSACSTPSARLSPPQQPAPTPILASIQASVAAVATTKPLTSSCPAHPAVMPTHSSGSDPAVIYLSEQGGTQTLMTAAQLIRYDTVTKSKATLLSFAQASEAISEAQLSSNGQWILFLANTASGGQARLQLIRADGQDLQTLFCAPAYTLSHVLWSPDSKHVAFAVASSNAQISSLQVLDLSTAGQEAFVASDYRPYAWLDTTRLYVTQPPQDSQFTSQQKLSLLDISQPNPQPSGQFTPFASTNVLCGLWETSSDSTQLFSSSCTPTGGNNGCQGPSSQGPSTLTLEPATGGSPRTIYQNQNQAILALHPMNAQTLLMYVENTSGDLSGNGLWKINADGSSPTRLTNVAGKQCSELGYQVLYPQIVSRNLSYAVRMADATSSHEFLQVGSLDGGAPTIFETKDVTKGALILVGLALL